MPTLIAYERRAGTSASISSIRLPARPRAWRASKASPRIPTRCARPSMCRCSGPSRGALQEGLWRYERSAGRSRFVRRRSESRQGHHGNRGRYQEIGRQAPKLATRAGERTAAALRRALDAGGGDRKALRQEGRGAPRRLGGRTDLAAVGGRVDPSQAQAVRCRVRQGHGSESQGQGGRARRDCACGRACRAPRWCWRTRPGAFSQWLGDFPIR